MAKKDKSWLLLLLLLLIVFGVMRSSGTLGNGISGNGIGTTISDFVQSVSTLLSSLLSTLTTGQAVIGQTTTGTTTGVTTTTFTVTTTIGGCSMINCDDVVLEECCVLDECFCPVGQEPVWTGSDCECAIWG